MLVITIIAMLGKLLLIVSFSKKRFMKVSL